MIGWVAWAILRNQPRYFIYSSRNVVDNLACLSILSVFSEGAAAGLAVRCLVQSETAARVLRHGHWFLRVWKILSSSSRPLERMCQTYVLRTLASVYRYIFQFQVGRSDSIEKHTTRVNRSKENKRRLFYSTKWKKKIFYTKKHRNCYNKNFERIVYFLLFLPISFVI